MAIAYARVTICSRSKGQSAVSAAAYRSATRLVDQRTNEVHDHRKREGHIFSDIYLPEGVDNKFLEREYFWNEVEKAEKRKDAQLAKEFLLALPKELEHKQQACLVKEFSSKYFICENIPVDISIYDKNDGNPFGYIVTATRRLIGEYFHTHKARDLGPSFGKGVIKEKELWGKRWGDFQSEFFERHNISAKVDDIGGIPQVHEGKIRNADVHYLKEENEFRKKSSKKIMGKLENQL